MQDIVTAIKDTPIPTILVVGGILFLLLSVANQLAGKITITPTRQKWAAIFGVVLTTSGVILYLIPPSQLTTPTMPLTTPTVSEGITNTPSSPTVNRSRPVTVAPQPAGSSTSAIPTVNITPSSGVLIATSTVFSGNQNTPPTALSQTPHFGVGVFEFKWPGNDCWDIYQGDEFVTFGCGTGKQTLQAGTYTIKPKSAQVFNPFDVSIKSGSTTTIEMGGVFEFKWPGNDCWDIYQGDEFVTFGCGTGKQALQAGAYTIKPKSAQVFNPFTVTIENGSKVSAP